VLSLLLQYFSFALAPAALASHDVGLFELDGNALDQATAGADWQNGAEGSADQFFVGQASEAAANDSTYFTTGGSKDENDIPSWAITTNSVPDKDELLDAYAAVYQAAGETWVYFGADRFDNDGDAQIGFWFFQNHVGIANGDFTGQHADGDVLILSEYTNGGVVDLVCAYEWDGAGGGSNIAAKGNCDPATSGSHLNLVAAGAACDTADGTFDICAVTNAGIATAPWSFTNKDGEHNFATGQFFEGGINLTDMFGGQPPCFGSFLAETRSSQETDAQLKDFALGSLSTCVPPTIVTAANDHVLSFGDSVTDLATLSGSNGPVSGSVTFFVCGPSGSAPDCSTGGTNIGTVAVTTSANGGTATSVAFTPTVAGTYCFRAAYTPDQASQYLAASHTNTSTECFELVKNDTSITTAANQTVNVGATISDSATLSGATSDAGGHITFRAYGPGDTDCSNAAAFTSSSFAVSGNGTYGPASFTPSTAGTYRWIASYSGDAKNEPSIGLCNDAGETDVVQKVNPTIATNASDNIVIGGQISDTATLAGGFSPTGSITFRLYGPADATCAAAAIFTSTVPVNGNGDYASAAYTANVAGTYRWIAIYSGDGNNAAASGACNDADENVVVTTPNIHATKLVATGDGDFGPTSVANPGDVLNFQITVTNSGNGAATNVPVSDNIAALLAHGSYNGDCNLGCNFAADTLSWTIPTLAANGGSVTLTFSVTLDDTFPIGITHLPNVVVVTGPGSNCAAGSKDPDCDTDTTVATSVLTIDKSFTGNTGGTDPDLGVPAAKVGDTLHYTLEYDGAGPITNAVITDVLPAGLEYVAGSAAGDANFTFASYDPATRTLKWTAATLPDPANGTVTYNVKVTAAAPELAQPLINVATIVSNETPADSDTASVAVLAPPLELTPPPTSTITPQTSTSNPGFSLMLILLGVAGLTLGIGFITPAPARARRRDRLG
jgi:uncharacterized repeat protein (TIGR01451 family)